MTNASLRRYAAEAMGTFVLVAIGPGAVMVAARTQAFGNAGIAVAFGVAVTMCVLVFGPISGAHINPAVTIGLWSVRRFPAREVLPYVIAQCVGAITASAVLGWILGPVGSFGATAPAVPVAQAFAIEAGYTALLGVVIMAVITRERTAPSVAALAIGATIFVGAYVTGPLTGGSFNPARSLGPAVIGHVWTAHWLYWLAPIAGAAIGMGGYALCSGRLATASPRAARW